MMGLGKHLDSLTSAKVESLFIMEHVQPMKDPLQIGILAIVAIGTERAHSSAVLVFFGCAILADTIVLAGPGVTTVSRRTWTAPQNV